MARNPHTFAKRQREMQKKRKAEEKRAKRVGRTQEPAAPQDAGGDRPGAADALDS